MSKLINLAIEKAVLAHAGQMRKWSQLPYVVHPLRVRELVIENGGNETAQIVALLHDVLEDTEFTIDEFSPEVQMNVKWLTCAPGQDPKKYLKALWQAPNIAVLVKLCDRLDNTRDLVSIFGKIKKAWKVGMILDIAKEREFNEYSAWLELSELYIKYGLPEMNEGNIKQKD